MIGSLFAKHGSDKNTLHSYGDFYEQICRQLEPRKLGRILEIGVQNGGSIRAFKERLGKDWLVCGADKDQEALLKCGADETFEVDQENAFSLERFLLHCQRRELDFELIIDDASHQFPHQLKTAAFLFPLLASNGIYCVEDLQDRQFAKFFKTFPGFQLIDLRDVKDRYDDMIVVLHKLVC